MIEKVRLGSPLDQLRGAHEAGPRQDLSDDLDASPALTDHDISHFGRTYDLPYHVRAGRQGFFVGKNKLKHIRVGSWILYPDTENPCRLRKWSAWSSDARASLTTA